MPRNGTVFARVYAALAYVCGLVLIFGAAAVADTHAAGAFIFILLPGALLAVLSPFIWSGWRSAMILALAVSVVLELMVVGNAPANWALFLAMPVLFGALTVVGFVAGPRRTTGSARRVVDKVFGAAVYVYSLVVVLMAPLNHTVQLGAPRVALYALPLSMLLGSLSIFVWRGRIWAMLAAFALTLAHWLVLASIDPSFWGSTPHIAAPVIGGILAAVGIVSAGVKAGAAESGA